MAVRGNVGKVQLEEFDWRIYDFSSIDRQFVRSPPFSFAGTSWYLSLSPNGSRRKQSSGYLDIFLYRITSGPRIQLKFSLGLKNIEGNKVPDSHFSYIFGIAGSNCGEIQAISRYELYERDYDYLPCDVLTVFCTMWYPNYYENEDVGMWCPNYYEDARICNTRCRCETDVPCEAFGSLRITDASGTKSSNPGASGHQSSSECVICCEKQVDCVLYRCGHMCMCYDCASKVWRSPSSAADCPICRKSIQDVIKIYK